MGLFSSIRKLIPREIRQVASSPAIRTIAAAIPGIGPAVSAGFGAVAAISGLNGSRAIMPGGAPTAVTPRLSGVAGTMFHEALGAPVAGRPESGLFGLADNRTLVKQALAEWGVRLGLRKSNGDSRPMRRKEFLLLVNKFGFGPTAGLLAESESRIVWAWFVLRRRRRMRGISARDIRRVHRAQATVRKARKIASMLGGGRGGGRRRALPRGNGMHTRVVNVD